MRGIPVAERFAALSPEDRLRCERIVVENAPLARWAVGQFANLMPHMELEDIESLMLETLWVSAMTWDPHKAKLSTYSVNLMRWQALRHANRPYRPTGVRFAPDGWRPLSLDYELQDGPAGAMIPDPTDRYAMLDGDLEAERLLGLMTTRERDIVTARMAGFTFEEIADRYGITRERVRQIAKKVGKRLLSTPEAA